MKKNTEPMEPDTIYHIFNRSINNETLFKIESNYGLFLNKYAKYISLVAETYAYCLLKNHFHFCIKTYSEHTIKENLINFEIEKYQQKFNKNIDVENQIKIENKIKSKSISWLLGNIFASFFKSYTQTINIKFNRTGSLFEDLFRRKAIENSDYFRGLIYYIHQNPQKHQIIQDFKNYPYSSYHSLLSEKPTKLARNEVYNWFGNKEEFEKYHLGNQKLENIRYFDLE